MLPKLLFLSTKFTERFDHASDRFGVVGCRLTCGAGLRVLSDIGRSLPASGFGVQDLGIWVWGLGFGVWGFGFGVWSVGFGVWGLGFGVWSLGFGVKSFEFLFPGSGFRGSRFRV